MRSVEDKASYRAQFLTLGQGRLVLPNDRFWIQFLSVPIESTSELYESILVADIRQVRDCNLPNFATLIRKLAQMIVDLHPPSQNLLNCIRLLTRLTPLMYEVEDLCDRLFWNNFVQTDYLDHRLKTYELIAPTLHLNLKESSILHLPSSSSSSNVHPKTTSDDSKPLATLLLEKLLVLLFTKGFTIAKDASTLYWEPGIGLETRFTAPNPILDAHRIEVVRLLTTLFSKSAFDTTSRCVNKGNRFLTTFVSQPKRKVDPLLILIMNLICRSSRERDLGLVHTNASVTEGRFLLVTLATQLLAILVVYPVPKNTEKAVNVYRRYLGWLPSATGAKYVCESLMNILRGVIDSNESNSGNFVLLGSQKRPVPWITETVILFWEHTQCNEVFRQTLKENHIDELLLILLYFTINRSFLGNDNLIRICTYFMIYLTSDSDLVAKLCTAPSEDTLNMLPSSFKQSLAQTSRDILVIQICLLIISWSSPQNYTKRSSLHPLHLTSLITILYNILPIVGPIDYTDTPLKKLLNFNPGGGLSYVACSHMNQLITRFSSRAFLLEKPFHADLLALIVRSICIAAMKYPRSHRMLLYSIIKNEKLFDLIWALMESLDTEYFVDGVLASTLPQQDDRNEDRGIFPDARDSSPYNSLNNSFDSLSIDPEKSELLPFIKPMFESVNVLDEEEEIDRSLTPTLPRGMSPNVREKLPIDASIQKSWGGSPSLKIILSIIIPFLKLSLQQLLDSSREYGVDSFLTIKHIEAISFEEMYQENRSQIALDFLPETPFEPLRFVWSPLSLGWYSSVLYCDVYNTVDNVRAYLGSGQIIKSILTGFAKLTGWNSSQQLEQEIAVLATITAVNHWNQVDVKLFKIEAQHSIFEKFLQGSVQPSTPVSQNLVRRFSDYRSGNNISRASISSAHSISSALSTPIEEQEAYFSRRNSVSLLHSLNLINRSHSNTPRNSISETRIEEGEVVLENE